MIKMVSKSSRKQRLRLFKAPLHRRHKELSAHLAPEISKKYGRRSLPVRKGDKVRMLRGDFKKLEGDVIEVDLKRYKVKVSGVSTAKADGTEVAKPVAPSNLMIIKLASDKEREKILERSKKAAA
jgi:large subunit ribosomal protein L24